MSRIFQVLLLIVYKSEKVKEVSLNCRFLSVLLNYSVIHISIHPSKELRSKMAPAEVGVSLP